MDIRVSYVRLLIGDNSRTAPTYTDTQIRSAITLSHTRPAVPLQMRLAGLRAEIKLPR